MHAALLLAARRVLALLHGCVGCIFDVSGGLFFTSSVNALFLQCFRGGWVAHSPGLTYFGGSILHGMAALLTVDAWEDQIPSLGARARLGQRLFASVVH